MYLSGKETVMYKILAIGAHDDECEYDVGGVSTLLADMGNEVLFVNPACIIHNKKVDKTTAEKWKECAFEASKPLGAKKIVIGPRDTQIFEPNYEIITELEKIILDFKPNIVFIHWPKDNHAEHRMVAEASYKALCIAYVHGAYIHEIYAFEAGISQCTDYFAPHFGVDITSVMDKVNEGLGKFDTDTAKGEHLIKEKKMQALYRGMSLPGEPEYAEVYRIVKFPSGGDDFILRQLLGDKFKWYGTGMYPAMGSDYF